MPTRTSTPHRALNGQCVVGGAAFMLGLVSVIMSVWNLEPTTGLSPQALTWSSGASSSLEATVALPMTSTIRRGVSRREHDRATPTPPIQAPNLVAAMVATAHRLQASPVAERRTFLLCTAVQVHAPRWTTPGQRPAGLSGHPR
jgi:hypothetical protein